MLSPLVRKYHIGWEGTSLNEQNSQQVCLGCLDVHSMVIAHSKLNLNIHYNHHIPARLTYLPFAQNIKDK